jgi:hypothetical protein
MPTLKFPIQIDNTGSLVVLEDESVDYYAQLLSMCALTEPQTHPFSPTFGVFDPTFEEVDRGQFILQASRFFPNISITEAEIEIDEQTGGVICLLIFPPM